MNQELDKTRNDSDQEETREWLESLQAVIEREGPERAHGPPAPRAYRTTG